MWLCHKCQTNNIDGNIYCMDFEMNKEDVDMYSPYIEYIEYIEDHFKAF